MPVTSRPPRRPVRLRWRALVTALFAAGAVLLGGALLPSGALAAGADIGVTLESMAPLDVTYNEQFQLDVTNYSATPTTGPITLSSTLPAGLTVTSIAGAGWTCTQSTAFTCTRSTPIAGGATAGVLLQAVPDGAAVPQVTLQFAVALAGDPNPANNTFSIVQPVRYFDDVAIATNHTGVWSPNSTTAQVHDIVTNLGDDDTDDTITVTDQLPNGVTFTAAVAVGWTCTSNGAQLVTCTTDQTRAIGKAFNPIALKVAIAPGAAPGGTNTATVHYVDDANPSNDSATDAIAIPYLLDLGIGFVNPTATPQVGLATTFSFAAAHAGSSATTGVTTLAMQLPPTLQVVKVTGGGWTCTTGNAAVCTAPAGKIGFTNVVVVAVPLRGAAPSIPISATLTTDGDGNPANNALSTTLGITDSCIAPNVRGQTVKVATATLSANGCALAPVGRFHKRRGYKLVAASTLQKVGNVFPAGTPINVYWRWKRKKHH